MFKKRLPDDIEACVDGATMPAGATILADLIARHVAGLVHPVTSTPGVVDPEAVKAHSDLLEAVYTRALKLLQNQDDGWCLIAAADARATSLCGVILDGVYEREPKILDLITKAGGLFV